jgi:hypothetical protein
MAGLQWWGKKMAGTVWTGGDGHQVGSGPPERLFDLANDIAPGQADIMKLAVGPARQFAPLQIALTPDMQPFADLGEKARTMTIYHRFMCEAGHFGLLKISS